jgi:hypothetical protein
VQIGSWNKKLKKPKVGKGIKVSSSLEIGRNARRYFIPFLPLLYHECLTSIEKKA